MERRVDPKEGVGSGEEVSAVERDDLYEGDMDDYAGGVSPG